jgi:hypothetical protein
MLGRATLVGIFALGAFLAVPCAIGCRVGAVEPCFPHLAPLIRITDVSRADDSVVREATGLPLFVDDGFGGRDVRADDHFITYTATEPLVGERENIRFPSSTNNAVLVTPGNDAPNFVNSGPRRPRIDVSKARPNVRVSVVSGFKRNNDDVGSVRGDEFVATKGDAACGSYPQKDGRASQDGRENRNQECEKRGRVYPHLVPDGFARLTLLVCAGVFLLTLGVGLYFDRRWWRQ